ncbi:PIN domain-containing protein [Siminovitchia fortis]|uniref:PIN domain-containing protein n=1 Tax=Siminovitchia fortis TaxID=254758 RepID=UPI00119D8A16|nr:PIN domain-containing protein [Siminovitchia fortis]
MSRSMIVDANILLRIATGQPADMASSAKQFFVQANRENTKIIVPTMVAAECCWVLKGVYQFDRFMIRDGLTKLFSLPFIELEDKTVLQALDAYAEKNVDFIDAYIAGISKDRPIVTWNGKHFKRLSCEFYSPEEIINSENF